MIVPILVRIGTPRVASLGGYLRAVINRVVAPPKVSVAQLGAVPLASGRPEPGPALAAGALAATVAPHSPSHRPGSRGPLQEARNTIGR